MGECFHGKKIGTCKTCREEECDALPGMIPTCVLVACATAMQRARANANRQVRRLQGACNVSEDEAVSDEENAQVGGFGRAQIGLVKRYLRVK